MLNMRVTLPLEKLWKGVRLHRKEVQPVLLRVHVTLDNPQGSQIDLKKLFQVVFLSQLLPGGTRQVDVYTALLISSDTSATRYLRVKIQETLDDQSPSELRSVGDDFFPRDAVLRQFWGRNTVALNGAAEISQYVNVQPSHSNLIASHWPAPGQRARPLLVREEEKDRAPLLVFPSDPMPDADSMILDLKNAPSLSDFSDIDLQVATGIWFRARFIAKIDTHHDLVEFEHQLHFEPAVKLDELRLYYSCPPHCDIVDQSGFTFTAATHAAQTPTDDFNVELYKVYSQPNTLYFDEWKRLGILRGTLLRMHPHTSLENALSSQFLHDIFIQFHATDVDAVRRREVRKLIASIGLATITTVGVDWARLNSIKDLLLFPGSVTPILWWLLMCVSMVPLIFGGPSRRDPRTRRTVLRVFGRSVFLLWFVLAFLLTDSAQLSWHLHNWLRFVPPVVVASGILMMTFYLMDYFRERRAA